MDWVPVEITRDPLDMLIESQELEPPFQQKDRKLSKPQEEESDDGEAECDYRKLDINLFVDQNTIKDYMCVICLNLAFKPIIHSKATSKCNTIFCTSCFEKFSSQMTKSFQMVLCPQNCSKEEFTSQPLPNKGPRSLETLKNLYITCPFMADCSIVVKMKNRYRHFGKCISKEKAISGNVKQKVAQKSIQNDTEALEKAISSIKISK